MIPIQQLMGYDPEENAAMVRNLNAQGDRPVRPGDCICPPCTGRCHQGRDCPATRVQVKNGGAQVDTLRGTHRVDLDDLGQDTTEARTDAAIDAVIDLMLLALVVLLVVALIGAAWYTAVSLMGGGL